MLENHSSGSRDTDACLLKPGLPTAGEQTSWSCLHGDSVALALSGAALQHDGITVIVTPDMPITERITQQIEYFSAGSGLTIHTLPDWETLPYDTFSPHQDIISDRLTTLYHLPEMEQGVILVPISTLMQRLAPREYLETHSFCLDKGQRVSLDEFRTRFEKAGYRCVSQVMEHGEFSVRGSLIDLYPMGSQHPFRIDLLDDEVDSIRTFDADTQRSLDKVDSIRLLPAREFPTDDAAVTHFRSSYRTLFEGDPQRSLIYRDVSNGLTPNGIEYYLPLFFSATASLFDYLADSALVISLPGIDKAADQFLQQINERYEDRRHDVEKPLLAPDRLYLSTEELNGAISRHGNISVTHFDDFSNQSQAEKFLTKTITDVSVKPKSDKPAQQLQSFANDFDGRVLITADSTGHREQLIERLNEYGIHAQSVDSWHQFLQQSSPLGICAAPLDQGFILEAESIAVITETQLFGLRTRQARRRKPARDPGAVIRNMTDLVIGEPVVHEEHGVGRYQGLKLLDAGTIETEFLTLEYSGGDKLYVPVSSLQLVSRYTGADPENAPLHRLGGEVWKKIRRKAAERVRDVAAELLEIYARREASQGYGFSVHHDEYAAFCASFPFTETPDQETAISQVVHDMELAKPMDRVICGDVGFGKTEVAMRAAFLAAQDGKQVAILVPTTLLAQQHYQNFCDRFADWPIRIEALSRFRTAKQQQTILSGIEDGSVDIVIGTHKLLHDSVHFKQLGLVIIDEEHRFGVRQKERLKSLRAEVDLLTLTATPIPRTMNMSMAGLRDLSILSTAPAHRLSVKTFVGQWHEPTVREACLREIKRGGQVFFLHNKVENIEATADKLKKLVPEADIEVAHGQMRERELERVMLDFYHRRFNILVCTTIIESGIDIPTANTIIINRADRFGLAQLHQLRGRVGRSHHRAYAYLVAPSPKLMTADAVKRLQALESLEALGAGFTLAINDLEIRGAGELLGDEQSGQIQEIGYTMYSELLERTIKAMRAGNQPELDQPLDHGPEIDLHIPALIPDDYLPDVHVRLTLYKRIANAADEQGLRDLQVEMIDRFGLLPEPTKNLFQITELKLRAQPLGIRKIEAGESSGRVLFHSQPNIDPLTIIRLVQSEPDKYKMDGGQKLRFFADMPDVAQRIETNKEILTSLAG